MGHRHRRRHDSHHHANVLGIAATAATTAAAAVLQHLGQGHGALPLGCGRLAVTVARLTVAVGVAAAAQTHEVGREERVVGRHVVLDAVLLQQRTVLRDDALQRVDDLHDTAAHTRGRCHARCVEAWHVC
jgi:hypothetical protein